MFEDVKNYFKGVMKFIINNLAYYFLFYQGLDLQIVENVEEAEFVLAHGTEALGHPSGAVCPMTLEELEKILERCAAKRIPMVVANPDFVTVEARALRVMPGKDFVTLFSSKKSIF